LEQIETQVLTVEAHIKRTDKYGQHLYVDIEVVGPNEKSAIVRTGWLVETNSDTGRLTTLYVKEAIS
jgi:filamentous hemagglutinin